ncbi:MAG: Eco57I restriction-modification methylase domain-containing protein, partial [Candidatus Limisoma sp.]
IPVYHYFVDIAKKVSPSYISMIMPARWYAGGRGLDEFRSTMTQDRHLRELNDYELSKDLFPTVDIAGGLCTFLWNKEGEGPCKVTNYGAIKDPVATRYLNQFNVLIRSNAAVSILNKITPKTKKFLNELVLSINPFGFRTYFRGGEVGDVSILTSQGWAKVQSNEISKGKEYVDGYKIIVGRFVPSNGEMSVKPGEGYRVITEPKILRPKEINTETYIDTAVFFSEIEAINYKKYLHSKFSRYLLRQGVTSVNVTRECFAFVPMQDFTESSDIDWSKSIEEIDVQLYKKYKLTDEEIAFIESMIKPM